MPYIHRGWETFYNTQFPGLTRKYTSVTTSPANNFTFPTKPTTIELSAGVDIQKGQIFKVTATAASVSGYVRALEDSSSGDSPCYLKCEPIFSENDAGESPFELTERTFSNAALATIIAGGTSIFPFSAGRLSIDLSDAPEGDYEYMLLVSCDFSHSGTSTREITTWVEEVPPGDETRLDAAYQYGQSKISIKNQSGANAENCPYGSVSVHSIRGGEIRDYLLRFHSDSGSGGETVTVQNIRMWALRIDNKDHVKVGTGLLGETTTTASSGWVDHLSLATLDATDYAIFNSYAVGHDTNGSNEIGLARCADDTGVDYVSYSRSFPSIPTTTRYNVAHCHIYTSGGTGNTKIQVAQGSGSGTGNSKCYDGCIVAIKISALETASSVVDDIGATMSNQATYTDLIDAGSDSSAVVDDYMEIISFIWEKNAESDHVDWYMRPNFNGATNKGLISMNENWFSGTATWMWREQRTGTASYNKIEAKYPDNSGPSIKAHKVSFVNIKERLPVLTHDHDRRAILVDYETGVVLKHDWTSSGGGVFTYDTSNFEFEEIKEVYINRTKMTRLATWSAGTDNTWHHARGGTTLTIEIDSADTPSDDDVWISVVGVRHAATESLDILDHDGQYLPYEDRLAQALMISHQVSTEKGRPVSSSSLGDVVLANGDGYFDDCYSRCIFSGHGATLRLGYPDKSTNIDDYRIVGRALQGLGSLTQENMSLSLFDRSLTLNIPMEVGTTYTIKKGKQGATYDIEDFRVPAYYGYVQKVPAYRTTANYTIGSGTTNSFVFSGRPCIGGTDIYAKSDDEIPTTATTITVSGSDGSVTVSNDAWPDDGSYAEVPEVIWVDIYGFCENPANNTSKVIDMPGKMIYDILTNYGGLTDEDIDIRSLRRLDSAWMGSPGLRTQFENGLRDWIPAQIGVTIPGDVSVATALDIICQQIFAYWFTNPYGRVTVKVPDITSGNLVANGYSELRNYDSVFSTWPWTTSGGSSFSFNATPYRGGYSVRVNNNSTANTHIYQEIDLPRSGWYCFTCVAKSVSGTTDEFRISGQASDNTQFLSPSVTLSTTEWTRVTCVFNVEPNLTGGMLLRLLPTESSTTATTVDVDEIEAVRVFAVLDRTNCELNGITYSPEDYFATSVTFDVDSQRRDISPFVTITNSEADGLTTENPEGRGAVQDSGILRIDATHYNGVSAAGTAGAAASYFGRQRMHAQISVMDFGTLPEPGDWVCVLPEALFPDLAHPRFPVASHENSLWRIQKVDYSPDNPAEVRLTIEQQVDPIWDRKKS